MNVGEITPSTNGTLWEYFALAIPLTLVTAWIIIAFQSKYMFPKLERTSFWKRLAWPFFLSFFSMSWKKEEPPGPEEKPADNFKWQA